MNKQSKVVVEKQTVGYVAYYLKIDD